jgi:Secretion system C-terminal sorting domain
VKTIILLLFGLITTTSIQAQLNQFEIAAQLTDAFIDLDTLPSGDTVKHQIFVNQTVPSNGKLLLFLPGTGARPGEHYTEICKMAANLGYRAIGLVYKNTTSVSQSCGTMSGTSDLMCSEDMRMETIYGNDLSGIVNVDQANSIMNRFNKLLLYLDANNSSGNWNDFIDVTNSDINWENIAIAGHSQGGGHAALIARDTLVNRVLFFNCPSDKNTSLFSPPMFQPDWFFDSHVTDDSSYYAFLHMQNLGPTKLLVYDQFGLSNFGAEVNVDLTNDYQNSHILYTDSISFDFNTYINTTCDTVPPLQSTYNPHSDIIVDCDIPADVSGNLAYAEVWDYMLSHITPTSLTLDESNSNTLISIYPNPSSGLVTITSGMKVQVIQLIDLNGRILNQWSNQNQIDLSKYENGIYLLQLKSSNVTVNRLISIK